MPSFEEILRKGPWSVEEDESLRSSVALLGQRQWDAIAKAAGLRRSGKSCRLRWLNYLRPSLKRGPINVEEHQTILRLQEKWGNKWARIARRLPGRTDNEIKNYWRTYMRKKSAEIHQTKEISSEIIIKDHSSSMSMGSGFDDNVTTPTLNEDALKSPFDDCFSDWISLLPNTEMGFCSSGSGNGSSSTCSDWSWEEGDACAWDLWDMDLFRF